jgi:hypothetical protein
VAGVDEPVEQGIRRRRGSATAAPVSSRPVAHHEIVSLVSRPIGPGANYDAGADWDADTRYGRDKLGGKSRDTALFALSQAVYERYRIRADYLRGHSDIATSMRKPLVVPHCGEMKRRSKESVLKGSNSIK